jgi:hypothetical protein
VKPGQFRSMMEGLLKKAKTPPTPRTPQNPIPWNVFVVALVFEEDFPGDMRAFIGNDRRAIVAQRFIQGAWISLASGEADFRTNRTAVESELLQAVQAAAAADSAPPPVASRGRDVGPLSRDTGSLRARSDDRAPARDLAATARGSKKGGGKGLLVVGVLLILIAVGTYAWLYLIPHGGEATPAAEPSAAAHRATVAPSAAAHRATVAPSAAPNAPSGAPSAAPSGTASSKAGKH